MERWSIELDKEYFKFSAAHFLIFPDGTAERLHGHNYRVFVEIEAALTRFGLVMDFTQVKPVVREIVDELDTEEGPDCLVTYDVTVTPPINPGTCAGCDPALIVDFAVSIGDDSTCQSPDLPPTATNEPDWRMAWNPSDSTWYRNMNGTQVWVAWWPAVQVGDTSTLDYMVSWPIFVDDEEM